MKPPALLCPHCGGTSRTMEPVRAVPRLVPGEEVIWHSPEQHRIRRGVYRGISEQFSWLAEIRVERREGHPEDTNRVYVEPHNLYQPGAEVELQTSLKW